MRFTVFLAMFLMAGHAAFAAAWYDGGTLQKATVSDWQTAAPANQLATAADFIASMSAISDLSTVTNASDAAAIKQKAEDLQSCISQSIVSNNPPPEEPVANLVVRCTILKPK